MIWQGVKGFFRITSPSGSTHTPKGGEAYEEATDCESDRDPVRDSGTDAERHSGLLPSLTEERLN